MYNHAQNICMDQLFNQENLTIGMENKLFFLFHASLEGLDGV